MNYELAKKLKEARFPQVARMGAFISDPKGEDSDYYAPTLSELIEACGKKLDILYRHNLEEHWFAGISDGQDGGDMHDIGFPWGKGLTPEEAVANLWLALNKKDVV